MGNSLLYFVFFYLLLTTVSLACREGTSTIENNQFIFTTEQDTTIKCRDAATMDAMAGSTVRKLNTSEPTAEKESTIAKSARSIAPMETKFAVLTWDSVTIQLGNMFEGDKKSVKAYFMNTGDRALSIKKVVPSCGCTLPSFPFMDIEPGERGFIGLEYNSTGKEGFQNATIVVHANTPNKKTLLNLLVNVSPKAKDKGITSPDPG